MGILIVGGEPSSFSSFLCQQKELQDCRRLSRSCHPKRSQKRSSDPAGAGKPEKKALLASPAHLPLHNDRGGRKPRLTPAEHQAGPPQHQLRCVAATPGPSTPDGPRKLPDSGTAPQARVATLALRAWKIFLVNNTPQAYISQ